MCKSPGSRPRAIRDSHGHARPAPISAMPAPRSQRFMARFTADSIAVYTPRRSATGSAREAGSPKRERRLEGGALARREPGFYWVTSRQPTRRTIGFTALVFSPLVTLVPDDSVDMIFTDWLGSCTTTFPTVSAPTVLVATTLLAVPDTAPPEE